MHKNIQTIALIQLFSIIAASPISFKDNNKYEGDNCTLQNGDEGICKKVLDCPRGIEQLEGNNKEVDIAGRCGFIGSVEIVCCSSNVTHIATPPPTVTGVEPPCTLKNGRVGVYKQYKYCKVFWTVPVPIEDESLLEKCEVSECDFSETVCCPTGGPVIKEKVYARPIVTACEEYKKVIPDQLRRPSIREGYGAFPGEFSFVVALGYENMGADREALPIKYNCGGSLLTAQYVLTAAHCLYNIHDVKPVEVFLGDVDLRSTGPEVQRIRIMKTILHPSYKRSKSYNDIAILKLEKKARISERVRPVCLETTPTYVALSDGDAPLLVTGWGATGLENDRSFVLLRTPIIRSVNNDECAPFYTGFAKLPTGIDKNMVCVIDVNKHRGSDACQGDSGGPLILESKYHYSVIGVTSFGQACGSYVPGIYTAVYPYLDWIEEQVWLNNDTEHEQ